MLAHERSDDAGVDADAPCVPARDVSRACTLRWARALGPSVPGESSWWDLTATREGIAVGPRLAGAALTLDGVTLRADDDTIGVGLEGGVVWARDATYLLASDEGTIVLFRPGPASPMFEIASITDGTTRGTFDMPGGLATSLALLPCGGCGERFVWSRRWLDSIDLGPLGTRTGPIGTSVVFVASGIPAWDVTHVGELLYGVGTILPPRALPDGSIAVLWGGATDGFCPAPGVCVTRERGVLALYEATGALRWARAPFFGELVMLADGGVLHRGIDLVRLDRAGNELWRTGGFGFALRDGNLLGDTAVDESANLVWMTRSIATSTESARVGEATVRDCTDRPLADTTPTSLIARLDLATGEVRDVFLPAEGLAIDHLALHPDGGVVLLGHTHTDGERARPLTELELCGERVTPEVGTHAELVIATIE